MSDEPAVEGREPRPWRGELSLCFLANAPEEAAAVIEDAMAVLENSGLFPQGGSCELMAAWDVVPDSPLSAALAVAGKKKQ